MNAGAARVLAALRRSAGRPCSGEVLSADLGVSRAQIWKHVETLRSRGYTIEGEPGGGYRLSGLPDRLYPEEIEAGLETHWLARQVHYFDRTDSTNRVAFDLARAGAPHGTAVVAEGQTAGRGRLGRSFFSPPYQNLYTSIVLRPELTTAAAPTLILTAGVAVADAVAARLGDAEAIEIKWPNDVLLAGRKTSGILMELSAEATRIDFLILGIGVNLNVDPAEFPEEFRDLATSVSAHTGSPVDRIDFARRLYGTLEAVLDRHARDGFEAIRSRFDARFRMRGRRVRVIELGGNEISGVALGIDDAGALQIERPDGRVERVVAGDVTLAKEEAAQ
jgi:BirA family biotin operon repressor/biotin-[acetyl-CoA-carboxylase] ligase